MLRNNKKNKIFVFVITVATSLIVFLALLFWQDMQTLNNAYNDLNKIEFLSSSTQRLISLAQSNQLSQKDIFFVGDSTQKALESHHNDSITVLSDPDILALAKEVLDSWSSIESVLEDFSTDKINNLTIVRDAHFNAMTNLSNGIGVYTTYLNHQITMYQSFVLGLIFFIGILMLNNILQTHAELKISKELASAAQIDIATGLFNRSRCQELFKSNNNLVGKKQPALLVFDLNDLKKTNDTLGHRVGDELISAFATALKQSCNVHIIPPFTGRYGGDEFIVYYDDISGMPEIDIYLKELKFLSDQFNSNETRFQISYAVGCSLSNENTETMTTRQLFDEADSAMYVNKIAVKKAKNPDFDGKVSRTIGS